MSGLRVSFSFGPVLALLALAGCRPQDDIRQYELPHQEEFAPRAERRVDAKRLIGALFFKGEETWVFKVDGPNKSLSPHKEALEDFFRTVRFIPGKDLPDWQLQQGWKEKAVGGIRLATLVLPNDLELALTKFAKQDLLANVNRWRNQVGLASIGEGELPNSAKKEIVDGVTAYFVDVVGPAKQAGEEREPIVPNVKIPSKYSLPDEWVKSAGSKPPTIFSFTLRKDDQLAKLTVTAMRGEAGGVVRNVERWRDEAKLPRIPDEEILKTTKKIEVDGRPAHYVDLSNPDAPGATRIVAVILIQDDFSWFFKMFGPNQLIESQTPTFEGYIRSIRFEDIPRK